MAANKLKAITAAAKKLYKTGRFKKWTDAIKAASKQISGTKTHKDTKSHNVNIRVVSGVKKKAAKRLSKAQKEYNADVKNYKYFIFADGKIQSGWEYLTDAKEAATDYESAKVLTIQQLKKLGLQNPIEKWLYKVGAVKIIQKGQSKKAKVTKVLQQVRSKSGTFKGYKTISGIENVSSGAKKLWLDINKKGLFKFNTEENILKFLYDESIRKGQFKKAEYLKELIDKVNYY